MDEKIKPIYRSSYLGSERSYSDFKKDYGSSKFDDWYWYTGRSERTGYTTGYRSKLGWESGITRGTSYSSVFWKPSVTKDKEKLITRAYNLAKEMILVMDTPGMVNIRIVDSKEGFENSGKEIFVSTSVFDDTSLDESEAVDIFSGSTIHEGCHLLYTDYNLFSKWKMGHALRDSPDIELREYVFNILEDERVESELGKFKPGLMVFLEKMKDYYFKKAQKHESKLLVETDEGGDKGLIKYETCIRTLSRIIRYPKGLTQEDLEINRKFFNHVQDLIIPLPESTKEALNVTDKICDFLVLTILEEESINYPDRSEKDLERDIKKKLGNIIYGGDMKGFFKTFAGAALSIGRDIDSLVGKIDEKDVSGAVSQHDGVLGKVLQGIYERGKESETIFIKNEGKRRSYRTLEEIYKEDKEEIQQYIPSIRKLLISNNKDYTGVLHGCKSGFLDTTKLAEAYQGVEHVYFKNYQVKTKKTSVCILIDESGSMGGRREESARKAAILLNEAFGNLPNVNLYIYGHSGDEHTISSDYSTDIYVYREPGVKTNKFILANSRARWQNRDGTALREIADRIRNKHRDQNEVLMFILSDGEPAAGNYTGFEAIEDTKKAVQEITKMRFIPVQISINGYHDPSSMFNHYIMLEQLDDLAKELGKVVKKAVLKAGTQEQRML